VLGHTLIWLLAPPQIEALLLPVRPPVWAKAQVQGYVFLALSSINVHVGKIAVRPEWRRRGVASGLLQVGVRSSA
jgi:GNAT superfamily N-acetyltransferase